MGSFEGHAIPSVIYSLLCLWWGFVTAVKHVYSLKQNKYKFQGSMTMPCFFLPSKRLRLFPFESFVKFTLLSFHTFLEYILNSRGHKLPREIIHHICMLSGFIVGAFVEILIFYGVPFPKLTEYFFTCLSFMIQTYLMVGHIHGDKSVEDHMHQEWAFVCFLTFIAMCLETAKPNCFWLVYCRIFFFFSQGTWLMQTALVVWPEKFSNDPYYRWNNDHMSFAMLDISLMYHFIGVAIVLLMQYLFVYYTFGFYSSAFKNYQLDQEQTKSLALRVDPATDKEYSMLMNEMDEE